MFVSKVHESEFLVCRDYSDYVLPCNQQLNYTLGFFTNYLVLHLKEDDPGKSRKLILVPDGNVETNQDGTAYIDISRNSYEQLGVFAYEEISFTKHFAATTIESRLLLASILVASSSALPEPHTNMTGSEAALNLLRQCWTSRPLTRDEALKLDKLSKLAYKEPALALLCEQLKFESEQRKFLFCSDPSNLQHVDDRTLASKSELRSIIKSNQPWNSLRRGLSEKEHAKYMAPCPKHRQVLNCPHQNSVLELESPPVSADIVTSVEEELCRQVIVNIPRAVHEYPLSESRTSAIGLEIADGLKSSWLHHQEAHYFTLADPPGLVTVVESLNVKVIGYKNSMEEFLHASLNIVPSDMKPMMDLLCASNRHPRVCVDDWLRLAVDDSIVRKLNPYFSQTVASKYQSATRVYLALCVLSLRLARLLNILKTSGSNESLFQELLCIRTWSWDDHPRWLVFEVEQSLQIWPEQYTIVKHLLESPTGTICQLNMGLGKTRVILPMLILHYAEQGLVPRVHVLASILQETLDMLHLSLTASTLAIKIVEQPFHRQIQLTPLQTEVLRQQIQDSCYVVTPEHRLSLEMKVKELACNQDPLANQLQMTIEELKFVDLFDEGDALFHFRYQLVYAIGSPTMLEQYELRAKTAHALLRVLNSSDPPLDTWIKKNSRAESASSAAIFRAIRLGEASDITRQEFRLLILRGLIANPTPEFAWLRVWCEKHPKEIASFESILIDSSLSAASLRDMFGVSLHYNYLLALRGYLAFGLLEHSLEQRHQVDYGIDFRRKKRVAVPFRAANVPSDRSEFGHPDVSLLLTTLAFYYQGLTPQQIKEGLEVLLTLGRPAQTFIFDKVLAPLKSELSCEEFALIENVSSLDITNANQMELLCTKLCRSMEFINFWLIRCVFEADLAQHPACISVSSWDLAETGHGKGLLATNDTTFVLPLQVTSSNPFIPSILGTNGRMVDRLLNHTLICQFLPSESKELWKTLVESTINAKVDALLDTGSLLTGVSNSEIVAYIASNNGLEGKHLGIVYFDTSRRQWMVLTRQTQQTFQLNASPIKERNCFVLFDDARSRGADMRLRIDAVAAITLGPKLTKDKLMQGAGRMRQLGHNQKLVILAPNELEKVLTPFCAQTTLEWVINNTVSELEHGLVTWSQQGLSFCKKLEAASSEVIDESWNLEDLFRDGVVKGSLAETVSSQLKKNGESKKDFLANIKSRCLDLGREIEVQMQYFKECEQELQQEEEQQHEIQAISSEKVMAKEQIWDYASALKATSVQELDISVKPLAYVAQVAAAEGLALVKWPPTLFGTINFFSTIKSPSLDNIRLADAVLVLPNGEWVLLSDKEADAILELLCENSETSVGYINFSALKSSPGHSSKGAMLSFNIDSVRDNEVVALALFNGETMFPGAMQQRIIKYMVAEQGCHQALFDLPAARGKQQNWDCSDLKQCCAFSL
ncbi:hypothetical protein AeMF1_003292 [Aphanomyces euteiches]|nr:hypothetical protein AeMF1_003292 [Aphanomyces euteiches]KAH9190921.1 hypothetical protein AeNC1_007102 [Aphanomyces euteiches]